MRERIKKWKQNHPDLVVLAAQATFVVGVVGLGFGLSRTFRLDAQDQVERFKAKNDDLNKELDGVWRWIEAQSKAGASFKQVDVDMDAYIDLGLLRELGAETP